MRANHVWADEPWVESSRRGNEADFALKLNPALLPRRLRRTCGCLMLLLCGAAPAAQAADWTMFRGGPGLLGVANGALPGKLKLLWSFKTGGPVKSSAAISQQRVFIGSDDGNVYLFGAKSKLPNKT